MARMRFIAAPVTPAKPPRQRRIGSPRSDAPSTRAGSLPLNESSWILQQGLDLREGEAEDFSTSPGRLWNLPKTPKP